MSTNSDMKYGQFYGTVAGINDHSIQALNEYQYLTSNPSVTNQAPYLQGLGADYSRGQSLGSLGGTDGMANALNNANQVVGWSQLANGVQHAFLYSNGSMQDLNLLVPLPSGIVLTDAVGIDASGQIVTFGSNPTGTSYEFLLTPNSVPEPTALALWCLSAATLAARYRLRFRSVV